MGSVIATWTEHGGNATALNTGQTGASIETWTEGGGNATAFNTGSSGLIWTYTKQGGGATTVNEGTAGRVLTYTDHGGDATVINTGTINGGVSLSASGGGQSTLTNSGVIKNADGLAIEFQGGAGTLNILAGSFIVGGIEFGNTAQTVNIDQRNFDYAYTGSAAVTVNATAPVIVAPSHIVSADPKSFGLSQRGLADFTYSIWGLAGGADNSSGASFTDAAGRTAWARGFYGARTQVAQDGGTYGSTSYLSGGAVGAEGQALPNLRVGLFAGGGSLSNAFEQGAGNARTDAGFAGLYGRYSAGPGFLDGALMAAGLANNTERSGILTNLSPTGFENPKGSFAGWLVNPAVAAGLGFDLPSGWSATPALKLRYLAAGFGGYTETDAASPLTFDARVLQDFEERAELTLARTLRVDATTDLRVSLHGGLLGLERLGQGAVNGNLFGQGFSFAVPGKAATAGAYGGADADFRIGDRLSLFLAGEYTATSEPATLATAKGGLRWQF